MTDSSHLSSTATPPPARPVLAIENHKLVGVPYVQDNMGGPLTPEVILIHYTASRSGPATARALQHETMKASVGVVASPDGSFIQQVPFNRVAWHAGKSIYKGRQSVSNFSIGIEVVNPGPIRADKETLVIEWNAPQGKPYPHMKPWTGGLVEAKHRDGMCPFKFWCVYPDVQITAVVALCHLLLATYPTITAVTGHENVAPGRKIDPGPAFPWGGLVAEGLPVDRACYDENNPSGY
jgi:N-acetylmuramoyl-L-alanine amidase